MHKIITSVLLLISFAAIGQASTNRYSILTAEQVTNLVNSTASGIDTNQSSKLNALPSQYPIVLKTPIRGIDPWWFNIPVGQKSSETNILTQIDFLYTNNLVKHGWNYVQLTDGWQGGRTNNIRQVNPLYISNITNLCTYANARGIGIIVYTEPRVSSSAIIGGGSYGYEEQDIVTFLSWGVKGIRLDMPGMDYASRMYYLRLFRYLMNKHSTVNDPKILYSSGWQSYFLDNNSGVNLGEAMAVADVLDVTLDNGMMGATVYEDYVARFNRQYKADYLPKEGHWLVPQGTGNPVNDMFKSFYGMYAMLSSGVMVGAPLSDSVSLALYRNKTITDVLGDYHNKTKQAISNSSYQVFTKKLTTDDVIVGMLNLNLSATTNISINVNDLNLASNATYSVYNVITESYISNIVDQFNWTLPTQVATVLKISPAYKSTTSTTTTLFKDLLVSQYHSATGSRVSLGWSGLDDYGAIGFVYRPGETYDTLPWTVAALWGNTNKTIINVPNSDHTNASIDFRFFGANDAVEAGASHAGSARGHGVWVFGKTYFEPLITSKFTNTVIMQGNLIISNGIIASGITLPTNSTAPSDLVTIKAWANFTNSSGGIFKMPLYQ